MSNRDAHLRVIEDVLERFAFMFAERDGDRKQLGNDDEYLHAQIAFKGRTTGALSIAAPFGLCEEMAANVLGLERSEIGKGAAEDTLRELANVTCGALICELFGASEVFDLTVPVLSRTGPGKFRELAADTEVMALWVEEQPMLFSLVIEEGAAS